MSRRWPATASWMLAGVASIALSGESLRAQVETRISGAVISEGYSFDAGLGYDNIAQFSTPLIVNLSFGSRANLVISSGYVRIGATPASDAAEPNPETSLGGILDTEARLTVDLIPDRVALLLSGVAPTGQDGVIAEAAPVLSLISTEVLDFSTVRIGSGGGIGGGVVASVPVGRMAIGMAATYNRSQEFTPVVAEGSQARSFGTGPEFRLRAGVEGPLAPRTYVRAAAIWSRRGEDRLAGASLGETGQQISLYGTVEQGVGPSILTFYGLFGRRGAPRLQSSAFGAALLPEASTVVVGGRLDFTIRRRDALSPRIEYRATRAAPPGLGGPPGSTSEGALEALGNSVRVGVDYRLRLGASSAAVFQADGLVGELQSLEAVGREPLVGVNGYRAGIRFEWTR